MKHVLLWRPDFCSCVLHVEQDGWKSHVERNCGEHPQLSTPDHALIICPKHQGIPIERIVEEVTADSKLRTAAYPILIHTFNGLEPKHIHTYIDDNRVVHVILAKIHMAASLRKQVREQLRNESNGRLYLE